MRDWLDDDPGEERRLKIEAWCIGALLIASLSLVVAALF